MISKELLSEVVKFENIDGREWKFDIVNNIVVITYNIQKYSEGNRTEINIYELAHKCKEWAFNNGYELFSNLEFCQVRKYRGGKMKLFKTKTEYESIFKACEWILQNER